MKNNGIHIRIGDLIYGVMKHRALLIALTFAGLCLGILLSGISFLGGEMTREYRITTSISINTDTKTGVFTSGHAFPNYSDINMAETLVEAVSYVLSSDRMLQDVIDDMRLIGIVPKDIRDNLTISQYLETQILEVELFWRNSQEGIGILDTLRRKAPELLENVLKIGSVSVINNPVSEYLAGGWINIVLWAYTTILGFGLGLGIIFLELIMRPTLLNIPDIETDYGMEVLCEIGQDKAFFNGRHSLLVDEEVTSDVTESFASAAHIIQTRLRKKPGPHVIYITSALREEGKTNIVANLAVQLSDLEKRVLLVDFDMKNPGLGRLFLKNVEYDHSLNALYAGDITESEAIVTLTGYLDLLPTVMERSSIPMDSNLFSLIEKIAANYEYVLIDTPPVGITADPMSLNQIVSEALFVIRYDTASLNEIQEALGRIEKSGVHILGCIVNGVQVSSRGIKTPNREKEKLKDAERKARNQETGIVSPESLAPASNSSTPLYTPEAESTSLLATFTGLEERSVEEEPAPAPSVALMPQEEAASPASPDQAIPAIQSEAAPQEKPAAPKPAPVTSDDDDWDDWDEDEEDDEEEEETAAEVRPVPSSPAAPSDTETEPAATEKKKEKAKDSKKDKKSKKR